MENKFLVLDFETNGLLSFPHNHAISFSVMGLNDKLEKNLDFYTILRRHDLPSHHWNPEAERIHGISLEQMLIDGRDPYECMKWLVGAMTSYKVVVCHNTDFDLGIMRAEISRLKLEVPNNFLNNTKRDQRVVKSLCTMKLARKIWPGQSATLQKVFNRIPEFSGKITDWHNAKADVQATANIFHWMYHNRRSQVQGFLDKQNLQLSLL